MKLTSILLVLAFVQVSAEGLSQNISIEEKDIPIKEVIKLIEKQSNYTFFYDVKELPDVAISLSVLNASIDEVLNAVFNNLPTVSFKVIKNNVVITSMEFLAKPLNVSGIVIDQEGLPIPGVTIVVKGTNKGVVTNADGKYSIEAAEKDTLVFSFVGYKTVSEGVNGRSIIDVTMRTESKTLEELVVVSTGYQTIKKEKVTGSTTTIGTEELRRKNVTSITSNLEATVPGLVSYYDKSTGKNTLTIRGIGSINASTNVLVVVDGLPVEGSIDDINPYDVESITVLKDAAAAAIYGARASNGVIVVVTRKAKGKEKTSVEFSSNITTYQKPNYGYYDYMSPSQQVDFENSYYKYLFNTGGETVSSFYTKIENGEAILPTGYLNYQLANGEITEAEFNNELSALKKNNFIKQYKEHALLNQIIQQYNVAIRGSSDKFQSSLVLNYKDDNKGIINAYNKQINANFKGTYKLAKWVDVDFGIDMIRGKQKSQYSSYATNPINVPSYFKLLNENGSRAYYSLSDFNIYSSFNNELESSSSLYSLKFNHIDELENDFTLTSTRNSRYFVNLSLKPFKGLTINPQVQYEDNSVYYSTYSEENSYSMRFLQDIYTTRSGAVGSYVYTHLLPTGGREISKDVKSPSYTARFQTNYTREFGKHAISSIAGLEFRETRSFGTYGALFGYNDQLQTQSTSAIDFHQLSLISSTFWSTVQRPNLSTYNTDINLFGLSTDTKHRYASGYANLTYTYDKKYNVFGSVRKDYADLYGGSPKYRGRPLWSAGAAWNISNEEFMKDIKFVNSLKLRASYGVTGNIATNYTSRLTASISGTQYFTNLPIATITYPPNSKLRWEKTATTNVGCDFVLFKNRLRGAFDLYWKKGTDLFSKKLMDVTQGYTSLIINNGDMKNKGVELSLSYDWLRPIKGDGFTWTSTLILSKNENKITKIDDVATTTTALAGSGAFKKGYPVNSLFSYQYAGLDASGAPQYKDEDGSLVTGTINSSHVGAVVFSGSTDPKVNASLSNEFSYKRFSLSVFVVYYGGHYFRDNPVVFKNLFTPEFNYGQMPKYLLNSWTPANTNTDIPGYGYGQYYQTTTNSSQLQYADKWVKHADFIKIRNIVFGYSLPTNLLQKIKLAAVKLRFQIDNPKTLWTKDDLTWDPETQGIPIPASYVFGVNVNF